MKARVRVRSTAVTAVVFAGVVALVLGITLGVGAQGRRPSNQGKKTSSGEQYAIGKAKMVIDRVKVGIIPGTTDWRIAFLFRNTGEVTFEPDEITWRTIIILENGAKVTGPEGKLGIEIPPGFKGSHFPVMRKNYLIVKARVELRYKGNLIAANTSEI